jgi:adenosylcobinamide-GDP ribazoletransferase
MRLKSMSAADTLRARLTELAAAVTLLTWLPVHRLPLGSAPNSASAVWAYPLVGALVGGIGGGAYWLDFADGLGGSTREQSLAIMRDHRIGSYGVIALILSLAIRITAIAVIAETSAVAAALIAAAATSRLAAVLVMAALPAARADGISASVGRPRGARAAAALGVTFVISWLLLPFGMALIAIIAAATAALAIGAIASARLGGQTGDVLGAAVVLAECLVLTALASALA